VQFKFVVLAAAAVVVSGKNTGREGEEGETEGVYAHRQHEARRGKREYLTARLVV
jgi:hypothetical protein